MPQPPHQHPQSPTAHPTPQEDTPNAPSASTQPNLPTRILSSATSLARNLVSDTNAPASAAAVLANSGKSSSSSGFSSSSSWAGPSATWAQAQGRTGDGGEGSGVGVGTGGWERGFREARGVPGGNIDVGGEFDAFMMGSTQPRQAPPDAVGTSTAFVPLGFDVSDFSRIFKDAEGNGRPRVDRTIKKGKGKGKEKGKEKEKEVLRTEAGDLAYTTTTTPAPASTTSRDVLAAEAHDGDAVLELLGEPSFPPLSDTETLLQLQAELDDAADVSADDLFGSIPTPTTPSTSSLQPTNTITNTTNPTLPSSLSSSLPPLPTTSTSLDLNNWLNAWDAAMANYTDEVWGPEELVFVNEAKEAVEGLKAGTGEAGEVGEQGRRERAVERLRVVLGHLGVV